MRSRRLLGTAALGMASFATGALACGAFESPADPGASEPVDGGVPVVDGMALDGALLPQPPIAERTCGLAELGAEPTALVATGTFAAWLGTRAAGPIRTYSPLEKTSQSILVIDPNDDGTADIDGAGLESRLVANVTHVFGWTKGSGAGQPIRCDARECISHGTFDEGEASTFGASDEGLSTVPAAAGNCITDFSFPDGRTETPYCAPDIVAIARHGDVRCWAEGVGPFRVLCNGVQLGATAISSIAVTAAHVYFFRQETVKGTTSITIRRNALRGKSANEEVFVRNTRPDALFSDATHLYWLTGNDLYRAPFDTGVPHASGQLVAKGVGPTVAIAPGQNGLVYFFDELKQTLCALPKPN